jgi:hypothetical protein
MDVAFFDSLSWSLYRYALTINCILNYRFQRQNQFYNGLVRWQILAFMSKVLECYWLRLERR